MEEEYYENTKTGEKVPLEDATNYVMKHYGLTIKPIGKHAELTKEQFEIMDNIAGWFFDDWDWVLRKEIDRLEDDYELEMADRIYQDNLDKRLLEE